ncbi:fibronectin type III domain-containing protein [Paenibacillus sambharensis]|uniref:rhamnogalacturonan lyase family protein n=1 Tax=Paenibacillus sambharensis TaxID=1803190 RepID=UPI0015E8A566|nr:Ig-like domain-containing protein [Paenibacillus sambharensis]
MNRRFNKGWTLLLAMVMLVYTVMPAVGAGLQTVHAEQAVWKFDFGTKTSPVLDGYTGIHEELLYTEETGYGLSAAVASRHRGGTEADAMAADFVLGSAFSFIVNIPDGNYNVTVYSGDLLTGTSTTNTRTTIGGELMGTISTRQAVSQATYPAAVTGGKLELAFSGNGVGAYVNGVVIEKAEAEPPAAPAAPTGLTVLGSSAAGVGLKWTESPAASGYSVYRSVYEGDSYQKLGSTETPSYTDTGVEAGMSYMYRVTSIGLDGQESEPSLPVAAEVSGEMNPPQSLPEALPYQFDFGPGEQAEGYLKVESSAAYAAERKYGFADPQKVGAGSRDTGDALKSDFSVPAGTAFLLDLPNGDYSVTVIAGDSAEASEIAVKAELIEKIQLTPVAAGEYMERTFDIALTDGQLSLEFSGAAPKLNGLIVKKLPEREAGSLPEVYIAGDSTVQTYDEYWKPEAGWGQMIGRFFDDSIVFHNHAIGGRSTKSFLEQGRLDAIFRAIKPNDYFLIQFGHNDATISRPERYASVPDYKNYLKTYVNGARQRGAVPILVTPVGRRDFNPETGKFNVSFPEYVKGMKEVAAELEVPLVDLSALSVAYYDSIGPAATLSVFLHVEPGIYPAFMNGVQDNTHFQEYGAIQLARLVSGAIKDLGLPLSEYVTGIEPPDALPEKPQGLKAGSISNATATLNWNASEGADIYRIYRKLKDGADYTLIGTAAVPQITIGGMEDGKEYQVRVSAVNGLGESELSDVLTIRMKKAQFKYDFGLTTSPVAEGYAAVTPQTQYTEERGYGLLTTEGMDGRDRGAGDDLQRDFIMRGGGFEFQVDLPNGIYSVKVLIGDMLAGASARTSVTIEGKNLGTYSSGKASTTEQVFNNIEVKDGRMNFMFADQSSIVNAVEITPVIQAPGDLKADSKSLDPDSPSVTLSWTAVEGAAGYGVYRKDVEAAAPVLLAKVAESSYTDQEAVIGSEYEYTVTTLESLDGSGLESVPSDRVLVSMTDPDAAAPPAPVNLSAVSVTKNEITITWNEVPEALSYQIFRADKNGSYVLIGKTAELTFKDTDVLTTVPYSYKVAAVNAGGVSPLSEALVTEAGTVLSRQMEYLKRALVAVKTDEGVYVGWRMLGTDPENIAFNLYRNGKKLNGEPLTGSTNYLDSKGKTDAVYEVRAVVDGREEPSGETAQVWGGSSLDIPLNKPEDGVTPLGDPYTYRANDASVGDLDGDGEYEFIVKWDPSNSQDNSKAGYTGNVYIDAYKLDGTQLWRIDLGRNIRAGAHYTQFMVYDLDGDGRAEVAMKTADGSVDGEGVAIGDPSKDFRNSSGYVLSGPEYLTIFDGLTGKALATTDYEPPRGTVDSWGDGYGNRVDRLMAAVAYLDGERPSLVITRGIYTRSVLAAYNWRDGELTKLWTFDTKNDGYGSFAGQGYHSLSVADVDRDGKDEIVYGNMVVDDDGTGVYSTGLGHGDALHVSDLNPARPGLEVFSTQENKGSPYGYSMRDVATGEVLWGVHTGEDTGRGATADIDPRHTGAEAWAVSGAWNSRTGGLYSAQGERISDSIPSANFAIWWDGDLLRELLDHNFNAEAGVGVGTIDKWDYEQSKLVNLLTATGTYSNNHTKGTPALQADLFGDWREEAVWRTEDSSALRIYTTTAVTDHRIFTLMHDPHYRLSIAWQNVGYNQPPHTSFFLGHGMEMPAMPRIYTAGAGAPVTGIAVEPGKADVKVGEQLQLKAVISPAGASDKQVTWTSADRSIAEVSEGGVVTGVKPGRTTITAATRDGGFKAEANIIVKPNNGSSQPFLKGPERSASGEPFDLIYGLGAGKEEAAAQDITIHYDAERLRFVSVMPVDDSQFAVADYDAEQPGVVRILGVHVGEEPTKAADGLLKLAFQVKPEAKKGAAGISVASLIAASGAGKETKLEGTTHSLQVNLANASDLAELITQAQKLLDEAVEGKRAGQYPAGSKAALQAAAAAAAAVADKEDASQQEIEAALKELSQAVTVFRASVLVSKPEDHNEIGKRSVGDLAVMTKSYGMTSADPGWNAAKKNDLNNDGKVEIVDLIMMARTILNK